ncbi:hypothetical protein CAEBREN_13022 [Caenorhabditis brenneri]|uniref:Uncharacterized protein n=1 Tax=Caenorhabditis brenneri TaxID=135651 RepID=G0P679_CAEBE|nr:hypothetical protein CAEBREN_13022 [Caenorhabditis brenneri]
MNFEPTTICKVCGSPSQGVHFGVHSCRACAAFFRRVIVLDKDYVCLQDKQRCNPDKLQRNSCRSCRYQKCIKMGMTSDNVQWDRDLHSTDKRLRENRKLKKSDTKIDFSMIPNESKFPTIETIVSKVFLSQNPTLDHGHFAALNPLQKFVEGLSVLRKTQRTDNIKFENSLSLEILTPHWTSQARNIAVLFMHFSVFRQISFSEQCRMFRAIWQNVHRLERIHMSTLIFGEKCFNEKKITISCERAIELDNLVFEFHDVSERRLQAMLHDYKTFTHRFITQISKPLFKLMLSVEEVAYLILCFILSNEDTTLSNSSKTCDDFWDSIATNLHDYYQKIGLINYASRIVRLMKIVNAMNRIHHEDQGGGFADNFKKCAF